MKKFLGLIFVAISIVSCQKGNEPLDQQQAKTLLTRSAANEFSRDTLHNVANLTIHGKTRLETEKVYTRVPASYYSDNDLASAKLRSMRWPECTAGFYISFETNSPNVTVKFKTMQNSGYYAGYSDIGLESGVELYEQLNGKMVSRNITIPPKGQKNGVMSYTAPNNDFRSYLLFFPAYNGIEEMLLQTKGGSLFRQKELYNESSQLPILYYGTSLTHGACASVYSKSYTALSLLELEREVINIGLNGCGLANEQMVDFILQQPSAAFVVDVVWNMNGVPDRAEVERRVKNLITRYRQNYPATPILLMSKFNKAAFAPGLAWEEALFKKIYLDLREAGITNLYFQPRGNVSYLQWGGGTHPNNVGMRTLADIIIPRLKGMLSGETARKPILKKFTGSNFYTTGSDNNIYIDGYTGLDSLDLRGVFPVGFIGDYGRIRCVEQPGAKKYIEVEQLSAKSKIKVRYADRDHVGYRAKVVVTDDVTCQDAEFNIVAPPVYLPTVTVAGREWMIFNNMSLSRQTAMADNMAVAQFVRNTADIEQILAEKDVHKYEQLVGHFYNYNKSVPATRVGGKPKVSPAGNPCPPGFELPTLADYRKLMGIPTLNANQVGAVVLEEDVEWKSADKGTSIILENKGSFVNGTLPRVATSVKYTKVTREGVSLYFINNGAFDAVPTDLLYEERCTAVLTQNISGRASVRICFGRYGWPVEANLINYSNAGYTGARCVKKLNYQTEQL